MMNERIKELAEQAANGMLSYDAEGDWRLNQKEVEKFAELIVRECCQKLENDGMVEVAMEMKEHFGVE